MQGTFFAGASSTLAGLALAMAGAASQAATLTYGFDTDAQGFTVTSGGTLTHVIEAGNGFLSVQDIDQADMLLQLPLGAATVDWSAYLGGTLSLDARSLNGQPPTWPSFGLLTLTSASGSVSFDFVPATDPGTDWATYTVQLDAATFGPGLASVLAGLQGATINLESGNGPIEVVGIDNLTLTTAVPEPEGWALALGGLALVAAIRRGRAAARG